MEQNLLLNILFHLEINKKLHRQLAVPKNELKNPFHGRKKDLSPETNMK